jgi:DNA-binding response OmpR family regulator
MKNEMATRVAVVDDEPIILALMHTLLTHYGYDALLIAQAVGAVEALVAYGPDLIVLDLLFGHEALGWAILAGVRAQPSLATTPIILCTAAPEAVAGHAEVLRARQTWVLTKPFDLAVLNQLLQAVLAQHDTPPSP